MKSRYLTTFVNSDLSAFNSSCSFIVAISESTVSLSAFNANASLTAVNCSLILVISDLSAFSANAVFIVSISVLTPAICSSTAVSFSSISAFVYASTVLFANSLIAPTIVLSVVTRPSSSFI